MEIHWTPRASREMDQLAVDAPRAVAAMVELIYGHLSREPERVGEPLRFELAGLRSARRAEYRILYRIDRSRGLVHVERVGLRRTIYRR
ncbi:MAG: type II toxin-antitoxin system RelE family toxin [Acidimicrobiales bacterium]